MGVVISSLRGASTYEDVSLEQPFCRPTKRQDITKANTNELFESPEFRDAIAQRLSGAVKIPTQTYDGMGRIGEDTRWEVFYGFAKYLEKTFPRVYRTFDIETVNEHAFLYTWKGSDSSLKPLVFMAHSDVVPASDSTADRWTHPPFEGHYDGTYIWGRGSVDDKSNVIAKLSAFEALILADFEPTRTIILALGCDEEGGCGTENYGAGALSQRLLEAYGEDGAEIIIDEGTLGIEERWGTNFAIPASAEKGHVDVSVTIDGAGGHSSTPPYHTNIGYLAQIIQKIEENQFPSRLTSINPTKAYLQTAAHHAKTMDKGLRDAILSGSTDKVVEYLNRDPVTRANLRTTTAVDVIQGGVKSNALPETASVLINHRIAVEESVQGVLDHYEKILSPLAKKWGFSPQAPNEKTPSTTRIYKSSEARITITTHGDLEPSPPSDLTDKRFSWLAGTIRGVFGEDVVVAPVLEVGNTDTRFYWKLCPQIYRFNPYSAKWDPRGLRIHTVDERMPVDGMLELVKFYHEFIRVVDEERV
ncbi:Gly-Xaa carboxypeptidase [Acephala macrosclerotiorum]|nr:Gly-Xaa carboxypeptidase [Acephala macrosclerotiorum]